LPRILVNAAPGRDTAILSPGYDLLLAGALGIG